MIPTSDYISKSTLLNRLKYGVPATTRMTPKDFKRIVEAMPEIDAVKVVHAEWVKEPDRDYRWHCSACGFVENVRCRLEKFCPNCGAVIDRVEEQSAIETGEDVEK